jgi:hypothetical protein
MDVSAGHDIGTKNASEARAFIYIFFQVTLYSHVCYAWLSFLCKTHVLLMWSFLLFWARLPQASSCRNTHASSTTPTLDH